MGGAGTSAGPKLPGRHEGLDALLVQHGLAAQAAALAKKNPKNAPGSSSWLNGTVPREKQQLLQACMCSECGAAAVQAADGVGAAVAAVEAEGQMMLCARQRMRMQRCRATGRTTLQ